MSSKKSRNLSILQGEDGEIRDIVEEVAHVEVYKFDPGQAKWDKLGVAGAGFIVHRAVSPSHRFMILNKQGTGFLHHSWFIVLYCTVLY